MIDKEKLSWQRQSSNKMGVKSGGWQLMCRPINDDDDDDELFAIEEGACIYYCIKECHLEGADLEVDVTDYVGEGDDEGDDE